jgi:hypothetical protein
MLTIIEDATIEPTRILDMGALVNPELSMVASKLAPRKDFSKLKVGPVDVSGVLEGVKKKLLRLVKSASSLPSTRLKVMPRGESHQGRVSYASPTPETGNTHSDKYTIWL